MASAWLLWTSISSSLQGQHRVPNSFESDLFLKAYNLSRNVINAQLFCCSHSLRLASPVHYLCYLRVLSILFNSPKHLCRVQFYLLPSPPGTPPGICNFFLTWWSIPHPRARRNRQFPTPGTPHRPQIRCFVFKIVFRTIAQPDVLTRT